MAASFFLICEACMARFESLEPPFNLAFAASFVAEKFFEITKWQRCIPTFLEAVAYNKPDMDTIFGKYLRWLRKMDHFYGKYSIE